MTVILADRDDLGRAAISFTYDPTVVDLIKSTVPGSHRKWEAATKTWWISNISYALYFVEAAKRCGHVVVGEDLLRPTKKATPQQAITLATPDDVFDRLLHMVGAEREDKIFAALVRILHPDTGTGSLELMQSLNRVRDRRVGRNCRPGATTSGSTR